MSLTKEDLNAIGTLVDNKLDSRLKPLQADIKNINSRLDRLEEGQDAIRASQVRVEAEYYPQVKGALDGIKGNTENIHLHGKRISALETKVENHGISMRILGLATT